MGNAHIDALFMFLVLGLMIWGGDEAYKGFPHESDQRPIVQNRRRSENEPLVTALPHPLAIEGIGLCGVATPFYARVLAGIQRVVANGLYDLLF